jgi:hypothetical protein
MRRFPSCSRTAAPPPKGFSVLPLLSRLALCGRMTIEIGELHRIADPMTWKAPISVAGAAAGLPGARFPTEWRTR